MLIPQDDLEAELACLEEELENEALFEEEEKAIAKAGTSSIGKMIRNLYVPCCHVEECMRGVNMKSM